MKRLNYVLALALLVSFTSAGVSYAELGDGKVKSKSRRGPDAELISEVTGLSVQELKERREAGQKLPEILEELGLDLDQVKDQLEAAREVRVIEHLEELVADGTITQEEADERLAKMAEREARHQAIKDAIENNDYTAWQAAIEGTPMAEQNLSATDFARLVEARTLAQSGDREAAKEIMQDLGIKPPKRGHGFGPRGGSEAGNRGGGPRF